MRKFSRFPFRILTGKVELELQPKLVDKDNGKKILLCPDLCTPKDTTEHLDRLVRVKDTPGGMSRSRTLAFLRDMPKIEICEDKRKRRKKRGEGCADDSADDTFVTHPQMTLTFWLHEPVSKAAFKIFGPLFLVLVLMLVNFEENFGFGNISECFDQGKKDDHTDYLANVIAIAIAAVVVVPSIRTTSVTSAVHSFTVDDLVALVFVVGLALSAWPVCGAALAGCMLSCLVVVGAIVSFVLYTHKRKRVVDEACNEPVARLPQKEDDKPSASDFEIDEWARQDESRPQ